MDPNFENGTLQCENTFLASTTKLFINEESAPEYMFLKVVCPDSPALKSSKCDAAMREQISRTHHQLFVNEESVPEYTFLKVVLSIRSCTLILKMGPCSVRTHFLYPPPRFHE
jgi:hypothetical protein